MLHQVPGFIDHEVALFEVRPHAVPEEVQNDVDRNRTQLIFQIADLEHDHLLVQFHVGPLIEESGIASVGVLLEHFRHVFAALRRHQHVHEVAQRGRFDRSGLGCLQRDALQGIGIQNRFVQNAVFRRRERSQHQFEEPVQVDGRRTQRFTHLGVFAADGFGQIERVDAEAAMQRHGDERSSHGFAELHVLVLRINDEHFGPEHQ